MKEHRKMTDLELIDLLKEDDQGAMRELFDRYWKKLFAVALNRLSSPESAEECVQDVLLSVWERRADFHLRTSLSAYLAVAVKYRAIRMLANEHRKIQFSSTENLYEENHPIGSSSVEEYLFEKELMQSLEASISLLPEKCQLVYRMSSEQGKSYKEIASELQLSEKTVQAHLTKAVKDLRKHLGKRLPAYLLFLLIGNYPDHW